MDAAGAVPPEHHEWVQRLRHGGPFTLISEECSHAASNAWACPPWHTFSVRGADYTHSKAKIPGGECLLQPLAFHLMQGPSQISHIMNHPLSPVRAALSAALRPDPVPSCPSQLLHQPFVWCFNFQLGTKAHHSLIHYFVSFSSPPQGSLTQKFLDGDDAFRNARLKLLTCFPEAPRLVQTALEKMRPVCMLGKRLKCSYMRGKHYMEVDVDVGSTMLSRSFINLTVGVTRLLVTDMAFVLEGVQPDELPERILGAMRLVRLDTSLATYIDMSEVIDDDMLSVQRGI